MSIKLSQLPPDPNTIDWNNPQSIKEWILQAHACIDELARKAQSLQMEVRTTAPSANDLEEGEFVRVNTNIYTKINGVVVVV